MKNIYIMFLIVTNVFISCDQFSTNRTIGDLIDPDRKEKEVIEKQIEQVYFNVSAGLYLTEENYNADDFPFYNMTAMELAIFSGVTGIGQFIGMMAPDSISTKISFEPSDIQIIEFDDKKATVKYQLKSTIFEKEKKDVPIEMIVKKIGGHWKLDGEKFFGD